MSEKFYITTTLPYLNADPHIGHALEFIQADVIARYKRLLGFDVVFNTGTDEHGLKVFEKAMGVSLPPQDYVDMYSVHFRALKEKLNLSYTNFIRTTDKNHIKAAQTFWQMCERADDIYKANQKIKYCVGCELEKNETELENGKCFIHPNLEIKILEEENYFFRFSKYQKQLLTLYDSQKGFVIPESRLHEIRTFVSMGLQDFSISRIHSKMPWGIPVPGDKDHVMYVWFDALINYISTLGWPENEQNFKEFWPGVQVAGKDNLRQQSAMWQAMLMSAGLPNSKQIFIHGFITSGGHKMSKSLGNVIDPLAVASEYGIDALRYFLLREIPSDEDGDFTMEKFKEAYNANLANGLGNLVARIMKMAESYLDGPVAVHSGHAHVCHGLEALDQYDFKKATDHIWEKIGSLDKQIQETEPFKLYKTDQEAAKKIVTELVKGLAEVAEMLAPFMPETSEKIKQAIKENKKPETLFERKL